MAYNDDKLAALSSAFGGHSDSNSNKIHVVHTVERTESPRVRQCPRSRRKRRC
jgi:hypothetical protein